MSINAKTFQKQLTATLQEEAAVVLAGNPVIETKMQKELAESTNIYIRRTLAANTSLTEQAQVILSTDEDITVRHNLARNLSLNLKPAILLYFGDNTSVVKALQKKHPDLYVRITAFEEIILDQNAVRFICLAKYVERREIIKNLVPQTIF